MHHRAEIALHQYMEDAVQGKTEMSEETIEQVSSDIAEALQKQFGSGKSRGDFKLRMSNVGRPTCQLWYEKNKPEVALPKPTTFIMNMMLGDIVEAHGKSVISLEKTNERLEITNKNLESSMGKLTDSINHIDRKVNEHELKIALFEQKVKYK